MESLVMVACTVSLTVGYPMTEITTVSDNFDLARKWNSVRTSQDSDHNREPDETNPVDIKALPMWKKSEQLELTRQTSNTSTNVKDITESLKLGHSSKSELDLAQVNENDVTRQNLVPIRMNKEHDGGLNLDELTRHTTDRSFQSIKSRTDIDFSIGQPEVDLESVQIDPLNMDKSETEDGLPTHVTFGTGLEDLTSSAINPDVSSHDEGRFLETVTSSGPTEERYDHLQQSHRDVAVNWDGSIIGITDSDLQLNQTQLEINQAAPEVNYTEPEVNYSELEFNYTEPEVNYSELEFNYTEPDVNYTELEVENFLFDDSFSVDTMTPSLEMDEWHISEEPSSGSGSFLNASEDSSSATAFQFPLSNESIYERLNVLVSTLEQLGVLHSVGQCYSVQRITKSSVEGSSALLKIELFLEARSQTTASVEDHDVLGAGYDVLGAGNESDLTSGGYSGEEEDCFVNGTRVRGRRVSGNTCISLMEVDAGNWTEDGTTNGTNGTNGTDGSSFNATGLRRNSASTFNTEHLPDNGVLKPSRTQILVISTCSSVIGLFFIVALVMRIRNYLKRTRSLSKHRNGLRSHSRQHIASALTNDPTALALPPRTPPIDCPKKEVVVKHKKETPFHSRGTRSFFFGASHHSNSTSTSSRDDNCPVPVVSPKMPQLRRQSELSRLFISQRSQRETAKEYIRQLSLAQAAPSNAFFLDDPPSPPNDASRKLLPPSSQTFQNLDMA